MHGSWPERLHPPQSPVPGLPTPLLDSSGLNQTVKGLFLVGTNNSPFWLTPSLSMFAYLLRNEITFSVFHGILQISYLSFTWDNVDLSRNMDLFHL